MRITKKYTGPSCIGKQVYSIARRIDGYEEILETSESELKKLEQEFLSRLAMKKFPHNLKPFDDVHLTHAMKSVDNEQSSNGAQYDYFSFERDVTNFEFGNISSRNSFTMNEMDSRNEFKNAISNSNAMMNAVGPDSSLSLPPDMTNDISMKGISTIKKRVTSAPNLQQLLHNSNPRSPQVHIPRSQSLLTFDNSDIDVVAAGNIYIHYN
jgi:hypothetical protein